MSQSSRPNTESSFIGYLNGFALSIYLTLTAYLLVTHRVFANHVLIYVVIGLALLQFLVQVLFFLHLGRETKPRWKLMVFLFMLLIVGVLVLGSLWIMSNLNYHHPSTPADISKYLNNQDGL